MSFSIDYETRGTRKIKFLFLHQRYLECLFFGILNIITIRKAIHSIVAFFNSMLPYFYNPYIFIILYQLDMLIFLMYLLVTKINRSLLPFSLTINFQFLQVRFLILSIAFKIYIGFINRHNS